MSDDFDEIVRSVRASEAVATNAALEAAEKRRMRRRGIAVVLLFALWAEAAILGIVLKAAGVTPWSWWIATIPLWAPVVVAFAFAMGAMIYALIYAFRKQSQRRKAQ
jgi:hypothetical protein